MTFWSVIELVFPVTELVAALPDSGPHLEAPDNVYTMAAPSERAYDIADRSHRNAHRSALDIPENKF